MYPLYEDIRTALGVPKWIDRNGVPRYCDFSPEIAGQIYYDWVSLMTVECQSCGKTFQCSNAISYFEAFTKNRDHEGDPIANEPKDMVLWVAGWGDAPWHDSEGNECGFDAQCAGTTMSTDFTNLRVWRRQMSKWVELENPMQYLGPAEVAQCLSSSAT